MGGAPGMTETQKPTEYHYAVSLDCGHFYETVSFVPIPPDTPGFNRGDPNLCPICRYHLEKDVAESFNRVTHVRKMDEWEWQA